ncbi:MAG: type II methionyl aminopeptidase [Methanobacteriota archaeon]|jgi:methionyl aminopeptidase|nr:MAG: type II methionyl aminopeptidase [Euryarchaeota archaeon]HIE63810.1 type II methionyl aminopeptidase [Candidatus Poseidoniales archaeon]HIL00013.1 type II methionyl aminopeptidase [Candidatus Poseidoniales archaeon]
MVEESDLKQWRDAGHVARRTLEGIKDEITEGKPWIDVIDSAERFIRRHGGEAAFPVTISVNEIAAHFTADHLNRPPEGWDGPMVFQKGDLVKLDVGVHIKGALADNAMTIEVGNGGNHTEQIKAARESRDAAIEMMHPGVEWHKIGAAAEQVNTDAGFESVRNLCGHQLERWNLHAGTSVPSYACGANSGFKGGAEVGGIYAIEPFNTTGKTGMIEDIPPAGSANILRITGNVKIRKALSKGKLKPLGATLARYMEERYNTLPFAERWAYSLLEKPFPDEDEDSIQKKWNALIKKLISIRFLEVYAALRDVDGGDVGQFEHTVIVTEGGPEVLTVA